MLVLLLCRCYHIVVGIFLLMFLIKCYCVLSQCCYSYKIIDCYGIRRVCNQIFSFVGFVYAFVGDVIVLEVGKCIFMSGTFENEWDLDLILSGTIWLTCMQNVEALCMFKY